MGLCKLIQKPQTPKILKFELINCFIVNIFPKDMFDFILIAFHKWVQIFISFRLHSISESKLSFRFIRGATFFCYVFVLFFLQLWIIYRFYIFFVSLTIASQYTSLLVILHMIFLSFIGKPSSSESEDNDRYVAGKKRKSNHSKALWICRNTCRRSLTVMYRFPFFLSLQKRMMGIEKALPWHRLLVIICLFEMYFYTM
jgi:hypothetical protein